MAFLWMHACFLCLVYAAGRTLSADSIAFIEMRTASRILSVVPSDGAATASRWLPAGIIPLPPVIAEPSAALSAALEDVDGFIDRLVESPLLVWLTIGRRLMADREGLTVRQSAWTDVDAAIAANGLGVAAWYTRDTVETAVCLVSRRMTRWSREERCAFAATHSAAEAASLALLARAHIPAESLRVLCAPFAGGATFSC